MARRDPKPDRMPGAMSVLETLAELRKIDRSLDAFVATAPQAVEELGGIDALRLASETTCVGPIPRLTHDEWAAMAAEHQDPFRAAYGTPAMNPMGMGAKAESRDLEQSGRSAPGRGARLREIPR